MDTPKSDSENRLHAVLNDDLLASLMAFEEDNQTLGSILADGCYHGCGIAKNCSNDECPERDAVAAWWKLIESAQKMRDQKLG